MKNSRSLLAVSVLALGGLLLTGCQTNQQSAALNQGASATASIDNAAGAITAAQKQIDVALASLTSLVQTPQDAPAQYKTVTAEFQKLLDGEAKVTAATAKMREQRDKYLAEWGRQIAAISDPALRDAAFIRRGEVAAKLQGITTSFQQVQASYQPFRKHLVDIKSVLGSDLSAAGLDAVKPFLTKATADAVPLKEALGKLAADFNTISASLKPAGTPAAGAPATQPAAK